MSDDLTYEEKLVIAKGIFSPSEFAEYKELLEAFSKGGVPAARKVKFMRFARRVAEAHDTSSDNSQPESILIDGFLPTKQFAISSSKCLDAELVKVESSSIANLTEVSVFFNGRDQEIMKSSGYISLLTLMEQAVALGKLAIDTPAIGFRPPGSKIIYIIDGSTRRWACIKGKYDYYIYVIDADLTLDECNHINDSINQKPKSLLDLAAQYSASYKKELSLNDTVTQEQFAKKHNRSVKSIFSLIKAHEAHFVLRDLLACQSVISTRDISMLVSLNAQFNGYSIEQLTDYISEKTAGYLVSDDMSKFQFFAKLVKKESSDSKKPSADNDVFWESKDGKSKAFMSTKGVLTIKGISTNNAVKLKELLDSL
ncbi:hypothetical protein AB6D11_00260 [Vibrio splendidus]